MMQKSLNRKNFDFTVFCPSLNFLCTLRCFDVVLYLVCRAPAVSFYVLNIDTKNTPVSFKKFDQFDVQSLALLKAESDRMKLLFATTNIKHHLEAFISSKFPFSFAN